jgi:ribosomal-protein-alanine N-acetyltransferase
VGRSLPPDTSRLRFGTWGEGDLELAWGLWGDPLVTLRLGTGAAWTREQVRARLEAEVDRGRDHGVQYWPIFLKTDGRHVGCCGLRPRDPEGGIWEFGVHLRSRFWGQGLATEAARAVLTYAFEERGASALFAGHHPENAASRNLLAELGFRYTHHELYPPTGVEHPSYLLTAAEFAGRSRPGGEPQSRRGSM